MGGSYPTKAIYEIRANSETAMFKTDDLGGFSYPYAVLNDLTELAKTYPDDSVLDNVGRLIGNSHFPDVEQGKQLFEPIPASEEDKTLNNFRTKNDGIAFHIQLDVDNQRICYEFNPHYIELPYQFVQVPSKSLVNSFSNMLMVMVDATKIFTGESTKQKKMTLDDTDVFFKYRESGYTSSEIESFHRKGFEDYISSGDFRDYDAVNMFDRNENFDQGMQMS